MLLFYQQLAVFFFILDSVYCIEIKWNYKLVVEKSVYQLYKYNTSLIFMLTE